MLATPLRLGWGEAPDEPEPKGHRPRTRLAWTLAPPTRSPLNSQLPFLSTSLPLRAQRRDVLVELVHDGLRVRQRGRVAQGDGERAHLLRASVGQVAEAIVQAVVQNKHLLVELRLGHAGRDGGHLCQERGDLRLLVRDGRLLRRALGLERGNQALLRLGLYLKGGDLGLHWVDESFQAVELIAQLRRPDARAIRW